MIESEVEHAVCEIAKQRGWLVRKMKWLGRDGAPDRFFVKRGRVVLPEFKRPGGKPREIQRRELERLRAAGVECPVIDSIQDGLAIFT